jgi:hypothetical protein
VAGSPLPDPGEEPMRTLYLSRRGQSSWQVRWLAVTRRASVGTNDDVAVYHRRGAIVSSLSPVEPSGEQ